MLNAVLDTNVLVSAILTDGGKPAQVMSLVPLGKIIPVYCDEILHEYVDTLNRPEFGFAYGDKNKMLNRIKHFGQKITPLTSNTPFLHENDRVFYDTAKACGAILITGNKRHYPSEAFIITPADFLKWYGISP